MGKNPSMIFKDLYRSAKTKQSVSKIEELSGIDKTIYEMTAKDGCYYVPFSDAVKHFLMEGYSEQKAIKHIKQWSDYDLAFPVKIDRYKLLAIGDVM